MIGLQKNRGCGDNRGLFGDFWGTFGYCGVGTLGNFGTCNTHFADYQTFGDYSGILETIRHFGDCSDILVTIQTFWGILGHFWILYSTTNVPDIFMAWYIMILRGATSLRGALEGVDPENQDFFGP